MKKCIIITSYIEGNLSELMKGQEADLILCADGGFDLAREAGITPDLLIGDFDSLHASLPPAIKTITFPKEKDDTDTGLCVRAAFEQGCREVLILGGLGGRFDHSIANIQLLTGAAAKFERIAIADEKNYCTVLQNGALSLPKKEGQHLSVFSLSEKSTGVSLSGVQYPLSDYTLTNTFPLGVSNEYKEDFARISVKNGTLLIVLSEE